MTLQDLMLALQGGQGGQGGGGGNAIPVSGIPAPTPLSGTPMGDQGAGGPGGGQSLSGTGGVGGGMGSNPNPMMGGGGLDMSSGDMSQLLNQIAAMQPGATGSLTAGIGGLGGGSIGQFGGGNTVGQGYGGQYGAGGVLGQQDPTASATPASGGYGGGGGGTAGGVDIKSILGGIGGAYSLGKAGSNLYGLLGSLTASPTGDTSGMGTMGEVPSTGGNAAAEAAGMPTDGSIDASRASAPSPGGGGSEGALGSGSGIMDTLGNIGSGIGNLGSSISNLGVGPVTVGSVLPYAGGLARLGQGIASGNENQIGTGAIGLGQQAAMQGADALSYGTGGAMAGTTAAAGLGGGGAASGLASLGTGAVAGGAMTAAQFIGDVLSGQAKDGGHGIGQGQRWGQAALNAVPGLNSILGMFGIDPYAPSQDWQSFYGRAGTDFGNRNKALTDFEKQLGQAQTPEQAQQDISQYNQAMGAIPGSPLTKGRYGIMQQNDFMPFETHGYFLPGTEHGSYLPIQYEKGTQLGYNAPTNAPQPFMGGMGYLQGTGTGNFDPSQAFTDYSLAGMPQQGGMYGNPMADFLARYPGGQVMPGTGGPSGPGPQYRMQNTPNIAQSAGSMPWEQMQRLNPAYAASHMQGRYQQQYSGIDQFLQGLGLQG